MKRIFTVLTVLMAFGAAAQNITSAPGGCGTVTPQQELNKIYDFVQHNPAAYQRGTGAVDSIPLSIHIVGTDAGAGYYQLTSLFNLICQLNDRFEPANFHFYVQWPIQYINNTSYYIHDYNAGGQMMWENNVPNSANIYFVQDPAGNCGYYTYGEDAVAVGKGCAASGSTTLAHELGHYFSLPHTFSGWEYGTPAYPERVTRTGPYANCNNAGDGFCDTDADYLSNRWSCPGPRNMQDDLGEPYHLDSSMYMSYSSDYCQSRFSAQQMAAMQYDLHVDRQSYQGAYNPHPLPLDTVRMVYPVDTLYTNLKKAIWKKQAGAEYYFVRIGLQSAPGYVLQSGLVADTFMSITANLADGGYYTVNVVPINAHSTCMNFVKLQPFIYANKAGQVGISNVAGSDGAGIVAYPNPVAAGTPVSVQLNGLAAGSYSLSITSISGQVVSERRIAHTGGSGTFTLAPGNCAPGLYLVRCKGATGQSIQKLIIHP